MIVGLAPRLKNCGSCQEMWVNPPEVRYICEDWISRQVVGGGEGEYAMCQKFRKFYFVKLVLSKCTCKSLFCSFWRSDFGGWSHKLTLSVRPSAWIEKRQEIAYQRFGRHPEGLSRLILFREIGLISFVKSVCPLVENIYIYILYL